jgi:hypothetical protein
MEEEEVEEERENQRDSQIDLRIQYYDMRLGLQ